MESVIYSTVPLSTSLEEDYHGIHVRVYNLFLDFPLTELSDRILFHRSTDFQLEKFEPQTVLLAVPN
jgi:hypothetical protein